MLSKILGKKIEKKFVNSTISKKKHLIELLSRKVMKKAKK